MRNREKLMEVTGSLGERDEARTAKDTVHQVNKRAFPRTRETHKEDSDDRRNIHIRLADSTGGEPEVAGAVGDELVSELIQALVSNQGESLQFPEQSQNRSEIQEGVIKIWFNKVLEFLDCSPPTEGR